MKGMDLSLFQFDWNTTFAAFFLHPDGTIYARYQPRGEGGFSTEGLARTMERVLEAHAQGKRESFRDKRGRALAWKTPEDMPALERFRNESAPKNCIHCHHTWTGYVRSTLQNGKTLDAETIWKYPMPDAVGLSIDPAEGTRVRASAGAAERAGVKADDRIVEAAGQPIYSIADFEWVLHRAPTSGEIPLRIRRGDETKELTLALAEGWRRGGRKQIMPVLGFGMRLEPLDDGARKTAGIEPGRLALRVTKVQKNGAARQEGLRDGDVLVSVADSDRPMAEDEFVALLRMKYRLGDKVKLGLVRGGERTEIDFVVR